MNGLQLHFILSQDIVTAPYFKGIYAKDTLPILQANTCTVVNSDDSTEPGSHWLALFVNENKTLEFFDSYGNSPDFYGLDTSHYLNVIWNTQMFQSPTSNVCGQYCVYFLLKRCQSFSLDSVLNLFEVCKINDFQLYQFVKKKYGVRVVFRK